MKHWRIWWQIHRIKKNRNHNHMPADDDNTYCSESYSEFIWDEKHSVFLSNRGTTIQFRHPFRWAAWQISKRRMGFTRYCGTGYLETFQPICLQTAGYTLRPSGRTRLLVYYAIPSSPLHSYLKQYITLKCLDIFCRGCGHNLVESLRIVFNILDRMLSAYPFIVWWRTE